MTKRENKSSANLLKQTKMMTKRVFTLLEMMVALLLLSLLGSLVAVQIKKLIDASRFEAEVSDLFIALQEAQVFAATYQTDLSLDLSVKSGCVSYHFSTDEPLSSNQFKQEVVKMTHVAFLKFQNAKASSVHLDVYSGGRIEPRGALGFFQADEKGRSLWFDLQYGQLFKFMPTKPPTVKQNIPEPPKFIQEKAS